MTTSPRSIRRQAEKRRRPAGRRPTPGEIEHVWPFGDRSHAGHWPPGRGPLLGRESARGLAIRIVVWGLALSVVVLVVGIGLSLFRG